jgi:hypothetical protein
MVGEPAAWLWETPGSQLPTRPASTSTARRLRAALIDLIKPFAAYGSSVVLPTGGAEVSWSDAAQGDLHRHQLIRHQHSVRRRSCCRRQSVVDCASHRRKEIPCCGMRPYLVPQPLSKVNSQCNVTGSAQLQCCNPSNARCVTQQILAPVKTGKVALPSHLPPRRLRKHPLGDEGVSALLLSISMPESRLVLFAYHKMMLLDA